MFFAEIEQNIIITNALVFSDLVFFDGTGGTVGRAFKINMLACPAQINTVGRWDRDVYHNLPNPTTMNIWKNKKQQNSNQPQIETHLYPTAPHAT